MFQDLLQTARFNVDQLVPGQVYHLIYSVVISSRLKFLGDLQVSLVVASSPLVKTPAVVSSPARTRFTLCYLDSRFKFLRSVEFVVLISCYITSWIKLEFSNF